MNKSFNSRISSSYWGFIHLFVLLGVLILVQTNYYVSGFIVSSPTSSSPSSLASIAVSKTRSHVGSVANHKLAVRYQHQRRPFYTKIINNHDLASSFSSKTTTALYADVAARLPLEAEDNEPQKEKKGTAVSWKKSIDIPLMIYFGLWYVGNYLVSPCINDLFW